MKIQLYVQGLFFVFCMTLMYINFFIRELVVSNVANDMVPRPKFDYFKVPDHELMPKFELDTVTSKENICALENRILELNFGTAGLTDRTGKIVLLAGIACRLDAKIIVPPPCKSLTKDHNKGNKIDCSKTWDDYIKFTVFKSINGEWKRCDDSIFTEPVNGMKTEIVKKVTPDMLNIKYNTKTPFHWKLQMSEYEMANLWKLTNKTLPYECNAERVFGNGIIESAKTTIDDYLPNKYLGIKIRRGDDIERTKSCAEPIVIQKFIKKLGLENSTMFVMMEPDDNYKNQLTDSLESNIVFESDIIYHDNDNYYSYIESYYILEHAPLGRIEIRRLETTDKRYIRGKRTCSLRYFPFINSKFLQSGFSTQYIDYYDI